MRRLTDGDTVELYNLWKKIMGDTSYQHYALLDWEEVPPSVKIGWARFLEMAWEQAKRRLHE